MPIYEKKEKINGQKRYYIRTYVTNEKGQKKQITRHNKNWIGRDGYWLAYQEESSLKNKKINEFENMTLDELSKKYIEYIESTLKPSSIRKSKDNYNLHISPIIGYKKIYALTTKDILEFQDCLDKKEHKIRNKNSKRKCDSYKLSTAFKQSIHTTLTSILNFGVKYYKLKQNVASITGNFKKSKGSVKKELNFLTENEFNNFINYENNTTYKDFFTLLFYTGMRRGELLALLISDINFTKNEININKSINPKNGKNATVPKTNKSNRKIKMLRIVKETLSKYKNTNDIIFGLNKITPTTLQRKCDKNCKSAQIDKNIRIHDFRHSFASMCINKGVPIEIISEYLGHENISTTLNIYSHLYPNSQNKLIEILDNEVTTMKKQKEEFIDYVNDIVNKCLLSGKTKEEISEILENINRKYSQKQDQKQDQ